MSDHNPLRAAEAITGLEVGPTDRVRIASEGQLRKWLQRNGTDEYRRACGEIHAALVDTPGVTFSELAENLGLPCSPEVRGKLVSLAHLGLVYLMEGVWFPLDPDYISGSRATILGWDVEAEKGKTICRRS